MPNPPPPPPPPSATNRFSPVASNCCKETMPDIPDSFMTSSLNKVQCALDEPSTVGDESDRNLVPNGVDHGVSSNPGESLGDASDGAEASADVPSEENGYVYVKKLITDFYETLNGDVIVRVRPKPLEANTVSAYFARDHFDLVFRTRDPRFLACEGATEETRFRWTCHLADFVKPEECKVRVQGLIEVTLRKENPNKKWTSLCAVHSFHKPSARRLSDLDAAVSSVSAVPCISPTVVPQRPTTPDVEFSTQPPPSATKPTRKGPLYSETGEVVTPGYTGLRNFGNTCFMNASLQALVNTRIFRDYFLRKCYLRDINRTNPLGFKGRLAEAFGEFVSEIWSGMNRYLEPSLLKELVGLKASQFANFAQHDAQEFLSFLLDGLHEDLNRVGDDKPLTPTIESDGRPDAVIADLAWRYHLMRNDSVVVDLFHGQLKSRLECPACDHTSITFDPFVYLPVPFPKSRRPLSFYYWSTDLYAKPVKYILSFAEDDSRVGDVFTRLGEMINVKPSRLRMIEVFRQKVFKRYNVEDQLALIRPNDVIFVFQVFDPEEVGDEVIEWTVIQRLRHPRIPVSCHCAGCGKESQDLRACTKCLTAAYCDVSCQSSDWSSHRSRCRPPSPELVGQPFLVSFPTSRATYSCLIQAMEARARHVVDVFQTLMVDSENDKSADQQTTLSKDPSSQESESQRQKEAVSMVESCGGRPTKRIRVLLGEPYQQPRSESLFQLSLTNEDGEYVLFDGKEKRFFLVDGDPRLALEQGACIAMDWMNKRGKNRDHLVVLTKDELEHEEGDAHWSTMAGRASTDEQKPLLLEDLFEHFTETETLSAEDAWYCSHCREHRQAKKTLQLWRLPPVLIVQLKRFVYTSNIFRSKIDKHVLYPIRDFDVRRYMSEGAAASEDAKTVYDLYGVVCHSGTSFFGHYTGFARLPQVGDSTKSDVEWRSFDDTNVTRVQHENQVVDPDAYFLFYKRRDSTAVEVLDRCKEMEIDGQE